MQELKGLDGYSLIISDGFLEKWRGPGSIGRVPLARYESAVVTGPLRSRSRS